MRTWSAAGDVLTVAQKCDNSDTVVAFDIFPENLLIDLGRVALPEGASIFLCDGRQQVLYANTSLNTGSEAFPSYIARMQQGVRNGYFDRYDAFIEDIDGIRRGVYYTWLENGWLMMITVPVESMLTQLHLFTLLYGTILAAWCVGFAIIIWRNVRLDAMMARSNETVKVLSNSYYGLFRINYQQGTYEMIKGSPYARKNLKPQGLYEEFLRVIGAVWSRTPSTSSARVFPPTACAAWWRATSETTAAIFWASTRAASAGSTSGSCSTRRWSRRRRSSASGRWTRKSAARSRSAACWRRRWPPPARAKNPSWPFSTICPTTCAPPSTPSWGWWTCCASTPPSRTRCGEYTDKIAYSGRQLLDLVNDILDMSRMEQGKVVLNNEAFDLAACVQACTDSFQPQARREGKTFTVRCEIADRCVMGDATRITQILNNLLSNAFKFTSAGESVAVTVRQMGGPPTPPVPDRGRGHRIGMSKEFLPQLF